MDILAELVNLNAENSRLKNVRRIVHTAPEAQRPAKRRLLTGQPGVINSNLKYYYYDKCNVQIRYGFGSDTEPTERGL
jgi:hypothetical protein